MTNSIIKKQDNYLLLLNFLRYYKGYSIQQYANYLLSITGISLSKTTLYKMLIGQLGISDYLILCLKKRLANDNDPNLAQKKYSLNFNNDRDFFFEYLDQFLLYQDKNKPLRIPEGIDWEHFEDNFIYYLLIMYLYDSRHDKKIVTWVFDILNQCKLPWFIKIFVMTLRVKVANPPIDIVNTFLNPLFIEGPLEFNDVDKSYCYGIIGLYYSEKARLISQSNPEQGLEDINRGRDMYLKGGYLRRAIGTYLGEESLLMNCFKFEECIYVCTVLEKINKCISSDSLSLRNFANCANANVYLGNFEKAMMYFDKSLNYGKFSASSKVTYLICLYALDNHKLISNLLKDEVFLEISTSRYKKFLYFFEHYQEMNPIEQFEFLVSFSLSLDVNELQDLALDLYKLIEQINVKYIRSDDLSKRLDEIKYLYVFHRAKLQEGFELLQLTH